MVACLSVPGTTAFAAATSCPLTFEKHSLIDVGVFDGPPAKLAEIIPIEGEWELHYYPAQQNRFYLGCRYKDILETRAVPVPTTATICRSQLSPRTHMQINVACE
jgi:hypothetical protein